MDLTRLLEPDSVAIVGASADPKKISGMMAEFVRKSGFAGRVYPVNPRYNRIADWDCYPSVEALPETVDVVVVVVPVTAALEAVEQAARRGVPFVVLMTGGFGEGRSGAEGEKRLERLNALCRETGMRVVGPNTVGMVNFRHRLPMTFADWYGRDTGLRGGVAILSHSGSVGGLIFSSLQIQGIGVDYWIATGNEANLELADFIDHLSGDEGLTTIACFMEGVGDGRRFMAACEKARAAGKRVVLLKSGASSESRRATLAHTRKQPGDPEVYRAVFSRLGVVEVCSLSELTYAVKLVTALGPHHGGPVGILSASGGACSIIADHVISAGLALPELPADLQLRLNRAIPEYGSSQNPIDLSADVVSRREILSSTLQALAEDTSIDIWMVFGRPVIDRYCGELAEFADDTGKGVIVSSGVPLLPDVDEKLRASKVVVLDDPELCMRALGRVQGADRSAGRPAVDWTAVDRWAGHDGRSVSVESGGQSLRMEVRADRDFGPVMVFSRIVAGERASEQATRILPIEPEDVTDALSAIAPPGGFIPDTVKTAVRSALKLGECQAG